MEMPPSLAGALKLPDGMSQLTNSEWTMAMTIHVSLLSGTSASLRVSRAADLFQWMCKALVLMGIWYDVYSPKLSRILLLYCFILLLSLFPLLIWSIHLHPPTFISHFSAHFLWDFSLFHGHPKLCHPGLSLLASERPETCCRARLVRESGGSWPQRRAPCCVGTGPVLERLVMVGSKDVFFFFFPSLSGTCVIFLLKWLLLVTTIMIILVFLDSVS